MMISFEDFAVGQERSFGAIVVSEEAILDFAAAFDPQPFHLDPAAAASSLLRGLCASGWHTASLGMRMICEGLLLDVDAMGSPGIDEVRWLIPVRPGDRLRMTSVVTATRRSRSRPELGLVTFGFAILNQRDATVMTQRNTIMVRCRAREGVS